MKNFNDSSLSFVYLHLDYIKDEGKVILRAPKLTHIVDSYERATVKETLIPYFKDSKGRYCTTEWSNINDQHVQQVLKEVEFFGRDANNE